MAQHPANTLMAYNGHSGDGGTLGQPAPLTELQLDNGNVSKVMQRAHEDWKTSFGAAAVASPTSKPRILNRGKCRARTCS